jgi:(S)-mandelate dehydrogenase
VVKAVALGATAVMLGRATLYGLSAKGEAGVSDVIAMIKEEIDRTLALIGSSSIMEVNRSCVARRPL